MEMTELTRFSDPYRTIVVEPARTPRPKRRPERAPARPERRPAPKPVKR
ncbi:MAG: hypothetical protein KJ006_07345 [Thermoleophilia bacterium]|nr:hypothetical protein [Thermoleophilia bacterium]